MIRKIGKALGLSESELDDQSVVGILLALLAWPFRLLWGFCVFMVAAWTTSRNGRAFLFALPAMGFAVFFVAVVWVVGYKGETKARGLTGQFYGMASNELHPAYDPDAALLYAKKMAEIDPKDDERLYFLGLSHDRIGEHKIARNIFQKISPDMSVDSSVLDLGYSDGYLWLSGYYADEKKNDLPEEERKVKSRKNLELAYRSNPENVMALIALGGTYRNDANRLQEEIDLLREEGNDELADEKEILKNAALRNSTEYFEEAVDLPVIMDRQLYASIALVEMLQEQGEMEAARLAGRQFIIKYETTASNYPDVLPLWVSLVKTCILIDDFERGEKFINQGYQLAQNPEIRTALAQLAAQIKVEQSKTFEDMDDEEQFFSRLVALSKAIRADVRVPEGYNLLLYYVDGFDMDSEKDLWLRDSVLGKSVSAGANSTTSVDAGVPGVIHIVLGFRDILNGQVQEGQRHWEIAGQQLGVAPIAINFLIMVYSNEREIDNEKRNELVSTAIELFPQAPNFYATRGRYLMEEEKHEGAIEDLEFAKVRIPDSPSILKDLVTCYEATGNQEKVDEYNAKIQDIESKQQINQIQTEFSSGASK